MKENQIVAAIARRSIFSKNEEESFDEGGVVGEDGDCACAYDGDATEL